MQLNGWHDRLPPGAHSPCSVAAPMKVRYGMLIKLRHYSTKRLLKSLDKRFPLPSISNQQMVVATNDETDAGTVWRVKGRHSTSVAAGSGQPVKNGDVVRLEHVNTRANLHSHSIKDGYLAPVTRDNAHQEVTAYGSSGIGDGNDDWIVETEGPQYWELGESVRLNHRGTGWSLHSHHPFHPIATNGFQEVTAYAGRDKSDFWTASHENLAKAVVVKASQKQRVSFVKKLLKQFPECVGYALNRRKAPVLKLDLEASVQDLLYFMLKPAIPDLKPEHPVAGHQRQYVIQDFRSPSLKIVIEAKRPRNKAHARKLIGELRDDAGGYKSDPACKDLIFFVYDPKGFVEDPTALAKAIDGTHQHANRKIVVHCIIQR